MSVEKNSRLIMQFVSATLIYASFRRADIGKIPTRQNRKWSASGHRNYSIVSTVLKVNSYHRIRSIEQCCKWTSEMDKSQVKFSLDRMAASGMVENDYAVIIVFKCNYSIGARNEINS